MNNFDNYFAMKWYEQKYEKSNKEYLLWVDDFRGVPNHYISNYHIIYARNYKEAITALHRFRFDIICLDHDLGEEKTGYDICKYIVEHKIICKEYRIHTSNPVGRKNMTELLSHYTPAKIVQM